MKEKEGLVKVLVNNGSTMDGCPQGKLNNDHGTPGPNCQ